MRALSRLSADLIKWARAPVAIWNGVDVQSGRRTKFDNLAIFTGSGTVVNGSIKLIYPGLCSANATGPGCPAAGSKGKGCNLGLAVPATGGDPLSLKFSKAPNAIANGTGRDRVRLG